MRNVANKKAWMAMAALAAAVAMSPRAMAQSTYTWDSSGVNPSSPVDGSGNWDLSTPDWSNNAGDVVWPNDASVAAFGNGGTAGTVMVQTPVNAGSLLFNPVASGTYTIASTNAITLGGTAAIGVLSNANISAPLGGSLGLIVNGTSTLNLSGANTYTGATVLDSGTLQLGSATALPATTAITVNSGATLDVNGQTSTAASLAGAGNVLLESGSNLTINQTTNSTFSGTLSGSGTLTKELAGTLTISAPSPSFTGTLALTNTNLNQVILSGNANINNGSIVVTNSNANGGGPELSLSNLVTPLTAPITAYLTGNSFRFTINAAAGANNVVSSPITANFSNAAPQFIFISDTGGGNLAISSNITVPNTATGAGLIVFRGALSESFTGSITAPATVAVATTNAGSCFFDPQPGSTWGATELMSTYTLEIPNDSALTDGTLSGATNSAEFFGGKLQLVNYTSNLNFVQANMSGTSALNLGAALGAPSTENGSINLTGTNVVNFVGPGTLIMNGSVTTGGAVNLTGGTLVLGNSNIFPSTSSPTVPAGATLDLNGQQLAVKAISGAGNIMLTGSGSELYLTGSSGSLTGAISGAGQLYENTGALTLSGNNTSYSGITTINGTVTLGNANALGTGDVDNYGTLAIGTFSPTLGSLSGYGGTITGSSTAPGNLTVGADNNSTTYGGSIANTVGSLTVVGTGTFTLGGGTIAYIGATNVNSGTLQLAGGYTNVLPTTTALTVASGATLDMNGDSQQIAALAGAGSVLFNGNGQLTVGGGNINSTFAGTISGGGMLVVQEGSNTFTITEPDLANTQLNSGFLGIQSDSLISLNQITFNGGALQFLNYSSGLAFNNISNLALGAASGASSTLTGAITGGNNLTYTGPGTLILTSVGNNYTGGTTIAGGNLQFAAGAFPGSAANGSITITAPGALNITGAFTSVTSTLPLISSTSTGAVALMGDSAENIDFTGYNSLSLGAAANSNYTGTITPGANGYNLGGGGAALTLPNANALTGGNNLAVVGSGTVALTGNNSNFTGAITLTSGILAIASDAAINNAVGGITFSGGTLQFNNYNSTSLPAFNNVTNLKLGAATGTSSTLNSAITGTSVLTYVGPGTLVLGSGVTLPTTSALTVSGGTLDLGAQNQTVGSITGAGSIAIESGSTLSLGSSTATTASNTTFSGALTGTGGFTKNNLGTLTLTGTSTITGPISIVQNSNATGTNPTVIALSGANASINSASLNLINSTGSNGTDIPILTLSNLGSAVTAPITVTLGGSNDFRAQIQNNAGANTVSSTITYNSTDNSASTLNFLSTTGPLTVTSAITATGVKPQITFRGVGATSTTVVGIFSGSITAGTTTIVGKTDPGAWIFEPAAGSVWGPTNLAVGDFVMGKQNALAGGTTFTIAAASNTQGAELDLNGFSQTINGLALAATTSTSDIVLVTNTSATTPATLTINTGTGSYSYGQTGSIIGGNLAITVTGTTGTETFNAANTYNGGTNLNGGTLAIAALSSLGSGPISFNGGAISYTGTSNTADLTTNGLTINAGGATINTGANTVTFANAISGGGPLTKTGSGSLTLNAPVNFSALTASAGTAHLASGGNTIAGTLAINTSSTVQIDGNTTAGKLTGDGTGTLKITAGKVAATAQGQSTLALASLSIAPGAVLDLDNGNLAINYGTGTDPFATIVAYIKNGYDHGNWDGASPVNGTIISSASIGQATALGYADNTTSQQVQVKYTWYGDLDLNGVVNDADLMAMGTGTANTWATGDLNYDGVVNADDFALFMYGNASQNNSISAGVPEPAGMALLVVPVAAGLIRRRRAIPNRSQI